MPQRGRRAPPPWRRRRTRSDPRRRSEAPGTSAAACSSSWPVAKGRPISARFAATTDSGRPGSSGVRQGQRLFSVRHRPYPGGGVITITRQGASASTSLTTSSKSGACNRRLGRRRAARTIRSTVSRSASRDDRLSRSVGPNEAARETKTAGLHFRARTLECLPRMTLCVEHVSFEREFRREFDDENADERAAVRRRERACAREGMK